MENLSMRYNCVALAGVNAGASLQKDNDGYYRVLLAALNVFNSEGVFYAFNESKHVFDRSNVFMRKVQAGNLYGEEDHPPWEQGMSDSAFMERNEWIETKNVSHHIREVELVNTTQTCNGMPVVEVWGWVKPNRERGPLLAEALENPHQNVCFSLRAIVREKRVNGVVTRRIDKLITFDWVIEDGLQICNKYSAMQRGSKVAQESTRMYLDRVITREALEDILYSAREKTLVGTESTRQNQLRSIAEEYLGFAAQAEQRSNFRVMGLGTKRW